MRVAAGILVVFMHAPGVAAAPAAVDVSVVKSRAALVVDLDTGEILAAKNAGAVAPVASLTKLMTALVVLQSKLPPDEMLEISDADVDREKRTPSRLKVGTRLTRDDLMLLSLMASENRAAMALSRHYPGGREGFLAAMNAKAQRLGMHATWFADPAGLSSRSVSTARDLHLLLAAAEREPLIRAYSIWREHTVRVGRRRVKFINSNRLVRGARWDIGLQKTGFTNEAGRCLMMEVTVAKRRLAMIFLDSVGKLTRYGDASRVRRQLERLWTHDGADRTRSARSAGEDAGERAPGAFTHPREPQTTRGSLRSDPRAAGTRSGRPAR